MAKNRLQVATRQCVAHFGRATPYLLGFFYATWNTLARAA